MPDYSFTVTVNPSSLAALGDRLERLAWAVKSDAQLAMGEAVLDVVHANFGETGFDRPASWAPLSPKYAKKVGRTFATLEVTGEMKSAVKLDNSDPNHSSVSISKDDCPYALAHQFGYEANNLPARPYFPVDSAGNLMPATMSLVKIAAEEAVAKSVRRRM